MYIFKKSKSSSLLILFLNSTPTNSSSSNTAATLLFTICKRSYISQSKPKNSNHNNNLLSSNISRYLQINTRNMECRRSIQQHNRRRMIQSKTSSSKLMTTNNNNNNNNLNQSYDSFDDQTSSSYHTAISQYQNQHFTSFSSFLSSSSSSSSTTTTTTTTTTIQTTYTPSNNVHKQYLIARIVPNEYKDYEVQKPSTFLVNAKIYQNILLQTLDKHNDQYTNNKKKNKNYLSEIVDVDDHLSFVTKKLTTIIDVDNNTNNDISELCVILDLNVNIQDYNTLPSRVDNNNDDNDNNDNNDNQKDTTIQLHLNRSGNESALRTLERLDISTKKKVDKILKSTSNESNNKKKKKKYQRQSSINNNNNYSKNEEGNNHIQNVCHTPTLYWNCTNNSNANNDDTGTLIEKINIENITTIELIHNLAHTKRNQCIYIDIPSLTQTCNRTSNSTTSLTTTTKTNITPSKPKIQLIANPPTILSIQTPFDNFAHNIYIGVPITVQTTIVHADKVVVSWFANDELVEHDSLYFIPSIDHLDKMITVLLQPIKCNVLQNDDGNSKNFGMEAYRFQNKVELLPYMPIVESRKDFIDARDNVVEEKHTTLRVVTYNILADLYVSRDVTTLTDENSSSHHNDNHKDNNQEDPSAPSAVQTQFPHVSNLDLLKKTRRLPMIMTELLSYKSDIICLQEVDGGSIYSSFIEPVMSVMGYDGYYSNKASTQREGCALFWKRDVFDIENKSRDLQTFSIRSLFEMNSGVGAGQQTDWESIKGIHELLKDHAELRKVVIEKIGQVLQIATLQLKDKGCDSKKPRSIVVANTHLFYHPLADHIRAMQTFVVCKKIDEIRRRGKNAPSPFLLCGDLNSDPLSGAAQLLFTRILYSDNHECWKHLHTYKWNCGENEFLLEHGFIGNEVGYSELKYEEEAFDDAQEKEGEYKDSLTSTRPPPSIVFPVSFPILISGCYPMPEFTNYAIDFIDTLDYILASEASPSETFGFRQKRSAPMPHADEITKYTAMPNQFMPSDHVSVACDLEWNKV